MNTACANCGQSLALHIAPLNKCPNSTGNLYYPMPPINDETIGTPRTGKPNRRAELLELASRLITAVWSRPDHTNEWADAGQDPPKFYAALATDSVSQAAAIIAEVDRVSGEGKP